MNVNSFFTAKLLLKLKSNPIFNSYYRFFTFIVHYSKNIPVFFRFKLLLYY